MGIRCNPKGTEWEPTDAKTSLLTMKGKILGDNGRLSSNAEVDGRVTHGNEKKVQ